MNFQCLCGCGKTLTGKQRKFYSDACRKRYNRKPESEPVRECAKNEYTVTCTIDLGQFPDMDVSEFKRHLIDDLNNCAQYREIWQGRVINQPGITTTPKLLERLVDTHRAAETIYRSIIEQLLEG